LAEQVTRYC